LQTLRSLIAKALEAVPVLRSCRSCKDWSAGTCLKWKASPPKDVQETGCAGWEFDPDSAPF
jgi:hypothetical protein